MTPTEESPATPTRAPRPPLERRAILLAISGSIAPADIAGLCRRARVLLEGSDAELIVCDVGALIDPDVGCIDALARLQLTARRLGCRIRVRGASGELRELLALTGLDSVVPPCEGLGIEPRRQAKEREQPRGVEEEADPTDPTV